VSGTFSGTFSETRSFHIVPQPNNASAPPLAIVRKHWFLAALAAAMGVGFSAPVLVLRVEEVPGLRSGIVAGVLFLMGLTIPSRSFATALRHPAAGLLACGVNMVVVPLLAALGGWLLPESLAGGLIVAAAAPCTLASAVVWTRQGNGDEAVAMLVTTITNLLCFLVAPATILLLLGKSVPLSFSDSATKLVLLVVVPLVLAQSFRQYSRFAKWTQSQKGLLTNLSLAGILVMVSLGSAHSQGKSGGDFPEGGTLASQALVLTVLLALAVHLIALAGGWISSGMLGLSRPQRVAVAISGSQKTLMVGLQLAIDCGVSTIPMVIYHLGQLLCDTLVVSRLQANAAGSVPENQALSAGEGRE